MKLIRIDSTLQKQNMIFVFQRVSDYYSLFRIPCMLHLSLDHFNYYWLLPVSFSLLVQGGRKIKRLGHCYTNCLKNIIYDTNLIKAFEFERAKGFIVSEYTKKIAKYWDIIASDRGSSSEVLALRTLLNSIIPTLTRWGCSR